MIYPSWKLSCFLLPNNARTKHLHCGSRREDWDTRFGLGREWSPLAALRWIHARRKYSRRICLAARCGLRQFAAYFPHGPRAVPACSAWKRASRGGNPTPLVPSQVLRPGTSRGEETRTLLHEFQMEPPHLGGYEFPAEVSCGGRSAASSHLIITRIFFPSARRYSILSSAFRIM